MAERAVGRVCLQDQEPSTCDCDQQWPWAAKPAPVGLWVSTFESKLEMQ